MRFLIVTKTRTPVPPEMFIPITDAMLAWLNRYKGKMEMVFGFAGVQGGGGVLNVGSPDELDAIMAEFPFAPFSETEVYALVDVAAALQRAKEAAQQMMQQMPQATPAGRR